MSAQGEPPFSVGQLAERAGLSVRTLHHWEDIGLLVARDRTAAGHRRYHARDVTRLQKILALRSLGLALHEIGELLDDPQITPLALVERQLHRVEDEIEAAQLLRQRLAALRDQLTRADEPDVDLLLQSMEVTTMFEKYYTAEQLEALEARREAFGSEFIEQTQRDWETLFEDVRRAKEAGVDPASPQAQALVERWDELIARFTGGDAGIARSLENLYEQEDSGQWVDPELAAYIQAARG